MFKIFIMMALIGLASGFLDGVQHEMERMRKGDPFYDDSEEEEDRR